MYAISILLRHKATDVSISPRISPDFIVVFQKITSFIRKLGFAVLHSCQLQCPFDVKNGNDGS